MATVGVDGIGGLIAFYQANRVVTGGFSRYWGIVVKYEEINLKFKKSK